MRLRLATMFDAGMLLEWRNDWDTRKMCGNAEPVRWAEHMQFLADNLGELHIAEHGRRQVGVVRNNDGKLSWTINPQHRGRGFGRKMVECYIRQFPGDYSAVVYKDNTASMRIAKAMGLNVRERTR